MRTVAWVVVALCSASCVKTERDYQLEYARTLTPKEPLAARPEPTLEPLPPRVLSVRVYVDLDYQAQVLRWNDRVLAQVAAASEVTKSALNLELKVASVETWNHHSGNVPIDELLSRLEREDAAKDVDLVIGFVSSLEIFTDSQEKLGIANVLGRHFVVRAMDNAAEHQAITRVFTRLTESEQTTLYRERKLHKERSVLLHELGHLLGAPHDIGGESLLNPVYAAQRARFMPSMVALLARSLELRDQKASVQARARALGEFIGQTSDLQLQDRNEALQRFERLSKAEPRNDAQQDRRLFEEVRRLDEQGKPAEALAALEPMLTRATPPKGAASYACQLSGSVSLRDAKTVERCERSVALKDDDGPSLLVLAQAQAATKNLPAARATFIQAREAFDARPSTSVEASAALGVVARSLGFVTWAERYAGRAMGRVSADEVLDWATRRRRWFGLPTSATTPEPRDEPAYFERFVAVQDDLAANRLKDADVATTALERDFPALPGPLTVRCELALRRKQLAVARAKCVEALQVFPDSLQAHYLLGVLASLGAQHRVVIEHLEFVVANDATVDDAWSRLSKAYAALGDAANRDRAAKRQPK